MTAQEKSARQERGELLREAQAWRDIAAVLELATSTFGLCDEICTWYYRDQQYDEKRPIRSAMEARVEEHLGPGNAYIEHCDAAENRSLMDTPRERVERRILAALFLALECEDEVRSASRVRREG